MGFYINRNQFLDVSARLRKEVDEVLTIIFGADTVSRSASKQSRILYRGTASYFKLSQFPFIVTSAHVLQECPRVDNVFHGKGEASVFPLRSGWYATLDKEIDIAVMGCFQDALDESGIEPLRYQSLLSPSFDHKDAFYYCNGYPNAHAINLPFMGEFSVHGNAFIGKLATLPKEFDSKKCFAIEYPCKSDPPGMSGSPVWNLRLHCMREFSEWSPEVASFAGVVQRWCPDEQILVVTRVEHIRDFVPIAIEHLRKKYRWKDGNDTYESAVPASS